MKSILKVLAVETSKKQLFLEIDTMTVCHVDDPHLYRLVKHLTPRDKTHNDSGIGVGTALKPDIDLRQMRYNPAAVRRTISIRAAFGGCVPKKRLPGSGMRLKNNAPLTGS